MAKVTMESLQIDTIVIKLKDPGNTSLRTEIIESLKNSTGATVSDIYAVA